MAHEGIYYHKRQMEQRLVAAEPLFEFWSELANLTPEESDPNQRLEMGDFKKYSITGDKVTSIGSQKCLQVPYRFDLSACRTMAEDQV